MRSILFSAMLVLVTACAGQQSALSGGSPESDRTVLLTLILTVGAVVIFTLVVAAIWIALAGKTAWKRPLASGKAVIVGGIVFPMTVLSALLIYGFAALAAGPIPAETLSDRPALRIHVDGRQWWWHITYRPESASPLVSANELRLPAGRPVELSLTSSDVIHSFWVPAYAGKLDMIPGRTNTLTLMANEPGRVRGQCAEYCGGAHALMAFTVITMEPAEFDSWLSAEAAPATISGTPGEAAFQDAGCGGCHTVRGTAAQGKVGPDLTHVASRTTLGAGTLRTDRAGFLAWLAHHPQLKPENLMPAYDFLNETEREAIADYLAGLT